MWGGLFTGFPSWHTVGGCGAEQGDQQEKKLSVKVACCNTYWPLRSRLDRWATTTSCASARNPGIFYIYISVRQQIRAALMRQIRVCWPSLTSLVTFGHFENVILSTNFHCCGKKHHVRWDVRQRRLHVIPLEKQKSSSCFWEGHKTGSQSLLPVILALCLISTEDLKESPS